MHTVGYAASQFPRDGAGAARRGTAGAGAGGRGVATTGTFAGALLTRNPAIQAPLASLNQSLPSFRPTILNACPSAAAPACA